MKQIQTNSSLLLETVEVRMFKIAFQNKENGFRDGPSATSFSFQQNPATKAGSHLQLCCKGGKLLFWGSSWMFGFWGFFVSFFNLCKVSLLCMLE